MGYCKSRGRAQGQALALEGEAITRGGLTLVGLRECGRRVGRVGLKVGDTVGWVGAAVGSGVGAVG